ncbi:MAG: hypothetical protein MUP85_13990, partial [Candidatus Lokiarchaeota archaeon]|nr:hypothetical protein [Candidatus Lokiarchaeota archaeon]
HFIANIRNSIENGKDLLFFDEEFKELDKSVRIFLSKGDIKEAQTLTEAFRHKFENVVDFQSIPSVNDLIIDVENLWNAFLNNQGNLKKQLGPLEIQFTSYLNTNNILLAGNILSQAKLILKNVNNKNLEDQWKELEINLTSIKKKEFLEEKVKSEIEHINKLTDDYKFDEAGKSVDALMELMDKEDLISYNRQFEMKKKTIIDAENKYNKLITEINTLEIIIKDNISSGLFQESLSNCDQIVKISRFIGKDKYVEMYSQLSDDIKIKLREYQQFKTMRNSVFALNEDCLGALEEDNFEHVLENYKRIRELLNAFLKV